MLTPIEIQGKTFKTGIGYDKKDVESFLKSVSADYEKIYKENVELNDKIGVLSEGIQYYKSIEKTLQKALVLAEKTAEETQNNAKEKAELILQDAKTKADQLSLDARVELEHIQSEIVNLARQFETMKAGFKQIAMTQVELLESDAFSLNIGINTVRFDDIAPEQDGMEGEVEQQKDSMSTLEEEALAKVVKEIAATQEAVKEEMQSDDDADDDFEFIDMNEE